MARLFWASTACLAAVLVPLGLAASNSTPQPTASASPVAKPAASPIPGKSPTPQPTPKTTAVQSGVSASAKTDSGTAQAASATAKTVSGTAQAASGTAKALSGTASTANHKSYALAEILSVVPGIAVHGAGHMYAGAWFKGVGLFAIEGACVAVGYDTVRRAVDSANAQSNTGGIPSDLSPYYTDAGVAIVTGFGFLWTWWDDMAGSGIAVEEYNKRQDEAALSDVHVQLVPAPSGAMLALSGRF